eukprot:gene20687-40540_t
MRTYSASRSRSRLNGGCQMVARELSERVTARTSTRGTTAMTEAVIVSTARTPIGKAHRGAFNQVRGADMAAHAIRHALERAGLEPEA